VAQAAGLLRFYKPKTAMSLSDEMKSAAAESQSVLAELGGSKPSKKNALYNGIKYLGVFGIPVVERQMLPSGGYRQRTVRTFTATRIQFNTAPAADRTLTRIDCTPNVVYRIQKVEHHDAFVYTFSLISVGE
jgi:hypothetical protein